jgi:uncharacterized damage-inducible protein DinB
MKTTYRKGGVGAMMDEYERAARELQRLIGQISGENFARVVDAETRDESCRSVQTIITHVVRAGYGYADYIRTAFAMPSTAPESKPVPHREASEKIDAMLAYTVETLEGKWEMTDDDIQKVAMRTRWGSTYDLEQLLEHAIVHILRHRRQVARFTEKMGRS